MRKIRLQALEVWNIFFSDLVLFAVFLFSHAIKITGIRGMLLLGNALGALLYFIKFRTKIVRSNLDLAMGKELSPENMETLIRAIYQNTGIVFIGIARNFALSKAEMCRELEVDPADAQKLREILARGKGAVFISCHTSNWELFAMGMACHGYPVSGVVKKMNNRVSQVLVERLRNRTGMEIIYSGGALKQMKESLQRGYAIGFMVDQNTTGKKGIRVNFFSTPASSIRGLANLVRETGTAVVPICAFRKPCGTHYVKLMDELPYLSAQELPENSRERIAREEWLNTAQYQSAIEKLVRLHPEQWLWIHRRWKAKRDVLDPASAYLENLDPS